MKKLFKQSLSLVLAALMVLAMVPATPILVNAATNYENEVYFAVNAEGKYASGGITSVKTSNASLNAGAAAYAIKNNGYMFLQIEEKDKAGNMVRDSFLRSFDGVCTVEIEYLDAYNSGYTFSYLNKEGNLVTANPTTTKTGSKFKDHQATVAVYELKDAGLDGTIISGSSSYANCAIAIQNKTGGYVGIRSVKISKPVVEEPDVTEPTEPENAFWKVEESHAAAGITATFTPDDDDYVYFTNQEMNWEAEISSPVAYSDVNVVAELTCNKQTASNTIADQKFGPDSSLKLTASDFADLMAEKYGDIQLVIKVNCGENLVATFTLDYTRKAPINVTEAGKFQWGHADDIKEVEKLSFSSQIASASNGVFSVDQDYDWNLSLQSAIDAKYKIEAQIEKSNGTDFVLLEKMTAKEGLEVQENAEKLTKIVSFEDFAKLTKNNLGTFRLKVNISVWSDAENQYIPSAEAQAVFGRQQPNKPGQTVWTGNSSSFEVKFDMPQRDFIYEGIDGEQPFDWDLQAYSKTAGTLKIEAKLEYNGGKFTFTKDKFNLEAATSTSLVTPADFEGLTDSVISNYKLTVQVSALGDDGKYKVIGQFIAVFAREQFVVDSVGEVKWTYNKPANKASINGAFESNVNGLVFAEGKNYDWTVVSNASEGADGKEVKISAKIESIVNGKVETTYEATKDVTIMGGQKNKLISTSDFKDFNNYIPGNFKLTVTISMDVVEPQTNENGEETEVTVSQEIAKCEVAFKRSGVGHGGSNWNYRNNNKYAWFNGSLSTKDSDYIYVNDQPADWVVAMQPTETGADIQPINALVGYVITDYLTGEELYKTAEDLSITIGVADGKYVKTPLVSAQDEAVKEILAGKSGTFKVVTTVSCQSQSDGSTKIEPYAENTFVFSQIDRAAAAPSLTPSKYDHCNLPEPISIVNNESGIILANVTFTVKDSEGNDVLIGGSKEYKRENVVVPANGKGELISTTAIRDTFARGTTYIITGTIEWKIDENAETWNKVTQTISYTYKEHGITEAEERIAPTCSEVGHEAGEICTVCGTYATGGQVIEKLPHTEEVIPAVPATCQKTGLTEGSRCSVCNAVTKKQEKTDVDPDNHVYVDGTCSCGATEVLTDANLKFFYTDAQLMVGEDIKGYFLFNKKSFTYDEYYAEFNLGGSITKVPVSMASGNYLYFFYTVYAFKMTESIEVTLYGVKDNVAYRGQSVTWTIRDAIVAKLDSWIDSYGTDATKTKGCDLLANMLNYGTEAQKELNKENTNYPTDNLDSKYLALIKTATPAMSTKPTDDEAGKQATAYSIGMMLQERIKLYAMFKVTNASATNDSDYKMVITLTHQDGTTSEYEYGSEYLDISGTKTKYVTAYFDQIKCQEMRCSMSFALYLNGEQISATIVRSADMLANDLLTKYPTLIPAIMNYSDCAELYFS